jgi:Asp-tRNA(Asn)/Glu-tRNA(Gln) amidotransferase A subunit family amidase
MAEECDKIRKQTGKRNWNFGDDWNMNSYLPPLFGIPISIKDTFDMEGLPSTVGLAARINDLKK